MKIFGLTLAGIVALGLLIIGLNYADIGLFKHFEPKRENARREVFEHTHSYIQGTIDELNMRRLDYEATTDSTTKMALRRIILTRADQIKPEDMPSDLRSFINGLNR